MAGLEGVVRPFQSRESSAVATVSLAQVQVQKNIVLQFGKGGSGDIHHVSYSLAVTKYMTKVQNEVGGDLGSFDPPPPFEDITTGT